MKLSIHQHQSFNKSTNLLTGGCYLSKCHLNHWIGCLNYYTSINSVFFILPLLVTIVHSTINIQHWCSSSNHLVTSSILSSLYYIILKCILSPQLLDTSSETRSEEKGWRGLEPWSSKICLFCWGIESNKFQSCMNIMTDLWYFKITLLNKNWHKTAELLSAWYSAMQSQSRWHPFCLWLQSLLTLLSVVSSKNEVEYLHLALSNNVK